ncbi:MAG: hypothetical protein ACTHM1_00165 [Solirubrobacteraceae bacterium]
MRLPALSLPPPIFAHLGHWYVSLPVFMGPVLLLLIALKVQTWRERRQGPDPSGKHSTVTTTHEDHATTITVAGPLDYLALLDIDVELGKIAGQGRPILIDMRNAKADEQAALNLCDIISPYAANTQGSGRDKQLLVLLSREPTMHGLETVCTAEGVPVMDNHPATADTAI